MSAFVYLFFCFFVSAQATSAITKNLHSPKDLEFLIIDILNYLANREDVSCVTAITDTVYLNVFEGTVFKRTFEIPFVMITVADFEDLLSPNFYTLESLRQAKKDGCNVYVILLANGIQAARLLRFGDRHRTLDTRANFILLHDFRLFKPDLLYLWKRIVNVVFLRYHNRDSKLDNTKAWFDISTVPFPNPVKEILVPRRVDIWRNRRFHYNRVLFADKTRNLNGEELNVVYLDHVPSVVVKTNDSDKLGGIEIEILKTLSEKMNFKPKLYQPVNVELYKWGHKQANGSFSGLLGEMVSGRADVALGNLQYTPFNLELTDLSVPYTSQCWTFLTPESSTDNSWKTLILPFKPMMWLAVVLVLLITGVIFHGLAKYYINLLVYKGEHRLSTNDSVVQNEKEDFYLESKPVGLYLFGEIINSILYTFGMLVVVSLPKLPTGWSIRLLTGWYWLYCILLVVSYRASMTAILANPAPRVTIDTLKELVDSKVTCGGWGSETKKFFEESLDDMGLKIGERFEVSDDPDKATEKVAQGYYAYYESSYYLKYLSVKRKNAYVMDFDTDNATMANDSLAVTAKSDTKQNLHIMSDCVVNIPISLGFHKNSPLKPLADVYLRRIVEVGLVEKWLNDAMYPIRALETEIIEIKALMNLKKLYGAFVALGIGYFLATVCLIGEFIHWQFIVKRDPTYDKYAMDVYYMNKNKKQ